jgi:hypothetical protein
MSYDCVVLSLTWRRQRVDRRPLTNTPTPNQRRADHIQLSTGRPFHFRGHSSSTRVRCRIVKLDPQPTLDRRREDVLPRGKVAAGVTNKVKRMQRQPNAR